MYEFRNVPEDEFLEIGKNILKNVITSRVKEIEAYELNKNNSYEFIFKASYYKNKGVLDLVIKELKISERSFYRHKKEYIKTTQTK